jgi:hypothetical protein
VHYTGRVDVRGEAPSRPGAGPLCVWFTREELPGGRAGRDDQSAEARYDAARYAALAAYEQGQDAAKLTEGEHGVWRNPAVEWLRAELARWATNLETAAPLDRTICLDRLRWWQQEPDLATVRDAVAVADLPADEQEACRKLWANVAALLKQAQDQPAKK